MTVEVEIPNSEPLHEFADFFGLDDLEYDVYPTSSIQEKTASDSVCNVESADTVKARSSHRGEKGKKRKDAWKNDKKKCICDTFELQSFEWSKELWIESPPLKKAPKNQLKWRMVIFPTGEDDRDKDFVSVYLKLESGKKTAWASFAFSILNEENNCVFEKSSLCARCFHEGERIGFPYFIEREKLFSEDSEYMVGGCLKLQCKVIFEGNSIKIEALKELVSIS